MPAWLSHPRANRALAICLAAALALVVGSAIYLQGPPQESDAPSVLGPSYAAEYSFVSPNLGWAVVTEAMADHDRFTVYATTDGSIHWRKQFAASMPFGLASVHFFDRSHGMVSVLSSPSFLYETADGGARWDVITLPRNVVTFVFADPWHGWLETWLGSSGVGFRLFSTSDAGRTWAERDWPAAAAWGVKARYGAEVQFRGGGEGWVGGNNSRPTVYLTRDDGLTWRPVPMPLTPAQPSYTTEVALLPGGGVMVVAIDRLGGTRGFITADHGATWLPLQRPAGVQYSDYLFADPSHWWAMRRGALYRTEDGGLTWTAAGAPNLIDAWTYEPHAIDSTHAWAVMSQDQVGTGLAMSSNAGLTWRGVNVPQPA